MLDGAASLGHRTDHVAGGVLQEDQGRAALVAQLDELASFGGARRLDRSVVAQDADQMPLQPGVTAHHVGCVLGLELQKIGPVHETGNDFPHVVGFALVGWYQTQQFLLVEQGFGKFLRCLQRVPLQLVEHFTCHADRVRVVLAQVLAQARNSRMGLGTANFVLGAILTDGGFDQRRSGQKNVGASAHQNHVVRQAWQVSTTGSGGAMHDGNLRQTGSRHARLVRKAAPAFDKDLALVHQIGASAFHQVNHRQLVLLRDFLRAQGFAQTHGRHCAALDGAVTGRNQAALAGHHANTNDGAAAQHGLLAVVVVHIEPGQTAEFQKGRTAIKQTRHPLTR